MRRPQADVSQIWRGEEQTPKSRKSIRAKQLLDRLTRVLKSHRELCLARQSEDYLFVNGPGPSYDPDDLRKPVFYPAMNKAGIERKVARSYGFHLFRHSAGSHMQEVTGDLKQTQSFLGHACFLVCAFPPKLPNNLRPDLDMTRTAGTARSKVQHRLARTEHRQGSGVSPP
jgi:integrase